MGDESHPNIDYLILAHGIVDLPARQVLTTSGRTHLTQLEADLLRYLAVRDHPVPTAELLREVWQYSSRSKSRAVQLLVSRLRKKIEPDPPRPQHLLSVHAVGYRLHVMTTTTDQAHLHAALSLFPDGAEEFWLATVLGWKEEGRLRRALALLGEPDERGRWHIPAHRGKAAAQTLDADVMQGMRQRICGWVLSTGRALIPRLDAPHGQRALTELQQLQPLLASVNATSQAEHLELVLMMSTLADHTQITYRPPRPSTLVCTEHEVLAAAAAASAARVMAKRGAATEALEELEAFLSVVDASSLTTLPARSALVVLLTETAAYARAREVANQAVRDARRTSDDITLGDLHDRLALIASREGDTRTAALHYGEARASYQRAEALRSLASLSNNLGVRALERGALEDAIAQLDEARAHYAALDWPTGEAMASKNLASVHLASGDTARARTCLDHTAELLANGEDRRSESFMLLTRGQVHIDEGRHDDAEDALTRARFIAEMIGERRIEGHATRYLGLIAHLSGRPTVAVRHYAQAASVLEEAWEQEGVGLCLLWSGQLQNACEMTEQGRRWLRRANSPLLDADRPPYVRAFEARCMQRVASLSDGKGGGAAEPSPPWLH